AFGAKGAVKNEERPVQSDAEPAEVRTRIAGREPGRPCVCMTRTPETFPASAETASFGGTSLSCDSPTLPTEIVRLRCDVASATPLTMTSSSWRTCWFITKSTVIVPAVTVMLRDCGA